MEPDPRTTYKHTIWFNYTRNQMISIKEGDLIAVPNFNSTADTTVYSILEVTSTMPVHYALGSNAADMRGYPGYVMEAAANLPSDWIDQEDDSFEDTTKIICTAVPIYREFVDEGTNINNLRITAETSLPMVGGEVRLLSPEFTERVFNNGIDSRKENVMEIGNLLRDEKVKIYTRIDELIKVHFGLFGFTGVGKSNFLSNFIYNIFENSNETVKIVLFDLMDEYTGLLIDKILDKNINSNIICIGERTLTRPVFEYINSKSETKLEEAADSLLKNLLVPKGMKRYKDLYLPFLETLLKNNKVKLVESSIDRSFGQFLLEVHDKVYDKDTTARIEIELDKILKNSKKKYEDEKLTDEVARTIINYLSEISKVQDEFVRKRISKLIHYLEEVIDSDRPEVNPDSKISITQMIHDLNNEEKSSLYIILSHDPNALRSFSRKLGYQIYESRRGNGKITPINSFIFDEADEFIPQNATGTYAESSQIIETLARRGRKFGLGIGIATQRITYLNTNIMGQPHTYFISKLPRDSDREKVAEAFAMSKEMLTQTFKFNKGDWLLVSHDATGLDAVPIPIKTENAEDRLKKFLGADEE
ncbi:MAG: ATP-binding protein [Euryarchaeota archaeon]|nr:ATP-binding protein [Euryarchaeota archaeon]